MAQNNQLKKRISNFMFDHYYVKSSLKTLYAAFFSVLGAALYAFCFCAFVTAHDPNAGINIITGGVGGISQNIWLITKMCGASWSLSDVQSILYFVLNIPLLIFAFFAIGKKFSLLTTLNVALSSVFITVFNRTGITQEIAKNALLMNSTLSRALFAGLGIGLSSALAFKAEISCGGIDIVSYYFALKKSTNVGKYTVAINSFIVVLYGILYTCYDSKHWAEAFISILFSLIYLLADMFVVDFINVRNKKVMLQIITSRQDLSSILIANFPHSTTNVSAKGGFTNGEKTIIYMVVSSFETNKVVTIAKRVDQYSFVTVTSLRQVYGHFFIKPVE